MVDDDDLGQVSIKYCEVFYVDAIDNTATFAKHAVSATLNETGYLLRLPVSYLITVWSGSRKSSSGPAYDSCEDVKTMTSACFEISFRNSRTYGLRRLKTYIPASLL